MENDGLDLESDPMQIYRSAINNEELRTGQRSRRIPDIPREEAIRDPETRETFIRHLQDLRARFGAYPRPAVERAVDSANRDLERRSDFFNARRPGGLFVH